MIHLVSLPNQNKKITKKFVKLNQQTDMKQVSKQIEILDKKNINSEANKNIVFKSETNTNVEDILQSIKNEQNSSYNLEVPNENIDSSTIEVDRKVKNISINQFFPSNNNLNKDEQLNTSSVRLNKENSSCFNSDISININNDINKSVCKKVLEDNNNLQNENKDQLNEVANINITQFKNSEILSSENNTCSFNNSEIFENNDNLNTIEKSRKTLKKNYKINLNYTAGFKITLNNLLSICSKSLDFEAKKRSKLLEIIVKETDIIVVLKRLFQIDYITNLYISKLIDDDKKSILQSKNLNFEDIKFFITNRDVADSDDYIRLLDGFYN